MSIEIPKAEDIIKKVFAIDDAVAFKRVALEVFHYQYAHNELYRKYADLTGSTPDQVTDCKHIPFLPISFFKSHKVQTTDFLPQLVFESSGTTGSQPSRHYVKDLSIYATSFTKGFEQVYGPIGDYCFLALLPSYLERGSSS